MLLPIVLRIVVLRKFPEVNSPEDDGLMTHSRFRSFLGRHRLGTGRLIDGVLN